MNKKELLENVYSSSFSDELEKISIYTPQKYLIDLGKKGWRNPFTFNKKLDAFSDLMRKGTDSAIDSMKITKPQGPAIRAGKRTGYRLAADTAKGVKVKKVITQPKEQYRKILQGLSTEVK